MGLAKGSSVIKDKSLVIVRMDAIGDFILFRNFIEEIAISKKYSDFDITLVGNILWKDIAESLDDDWINHFIWVNPVKFQKDFLYRKKIVTQLNKWRYDILYHPTFSPDYYVAETIVKLIHANTKVGIKGDINNTSNWQKSLCEKTYNYVIEAEEFPLFEFEKNKLINHLFLEQSAAIEKPFINANKLKQKNLYPGDYIILFIGGGEEFRKWNNKNWVSLINLFLKEYPYDILILGGPSEIKPGEAIKREFNNTTRVKNKCGKTTFEELMVLINESKIIVSNDTSAQHLAVALSTPVLVISNGNNYGRFTPYPYSVFASYNVVFPHEIEIIKDKNALAQKLAIKSYSDINTISPETVFIKIKKLLST